MCSFRILASIKKLADNSNSISVYSILYFWLKYPDKVPINFWRNSDRFKKENTFVTINLIEFEFFLYNFQIFNSKSHKYRPNMFKTVPGPQFKRKAL